MAVAGKQATCGSSEHNEEHVNISRVLLFYLICARYRSPYLGTHVSKASILLSPTGRVHNSASSMGNLLFFFI